MSKLREYISVGFCNSYGDADFAVSVAVGDLTFEQMQELRAMIPVAISILEKHWAEGKTMQERMSANCAAKSSTPYAKPGQG